MTQTTSTAASLVADGSYPAKIVAVELTLTPEAVPAWEIFFLIRDPHSAQQFNFALGCVRTQTSTVQIAGEGAKVGTPANNSGTS